jgi:hypothetical protein
MTFAGGSSQNLVVTISAFSLFSTTYSCFGERTANPTFFEGCAGSTSGSYWRQQHIRFGLRIRKYRHGPGVSAFSGLLEIIYMGR